MDYISKSPEETKEIAKDFISSLVVNNKKATVMGLYGELGSGKTTFTKYLAENFGIQETIQSPTFVIMKKYRIQNLDSGFEFLIHIDAYRIEKEEEMLNLDWEKIIADSKNLICVEWPERIAGIMPEHAKIFFEHVSENERKIMI